MRWTDWLLAVMVLGLSGPAAGYQPGCTNCNGGSNADSWLQRGLGADACASPCGHALAPGCCEDTRHCCDNAWAGYCDRRAQVEAFWARVGTPAAYARSRSCRQTQMAPCSSCDSYPTPAMQQTPADSTPAHAAMPAHTRR